jgi:hypothetical protein
MNLARFGSLYLDTDRIIYVRRFMPQVKAPPPDNQGGVRIGFEQRELTLYDDDPGYVEFIQWLERQERPAGFRAGE